MPFAPLILILTAQVPTTALLGLEFRPDGIAYSCVQADKSVSSVVSDATGESGGFGLNMLTKVTLDRKLTELPVASRKSPSGASLELELVQAKGNWKYDRFFWAANPGRTGVMSSNARLFLINGSRRQLIGRFIAFGTAGTITPYWSPDGERVALGLESFNGDTEKRDVCLAWAPARGPSIELTSFEVPYTSREAVLRAVGIEERIVGKLRAAGLPVLYFGYAKQERKNNVLFAPKDFPEAEVARIKEAVGELTVEPLTWKSKGDVVLVLAKER